LLFSKAEVPLIAEALPMLYNLHQSMEAVVKDTPPEDNIDDDDPLPPTPAVIRIAARASTILIDKYINLMKKS